MKLLLTSQMIHNQSIGSAFRDLLDKPFSEASVAYIITSHNAARHEKSWLAENMNSLYSLGWKEFFVIDVAGADGLPQDQRMVQIEQADAIVVGGGANFFLSYWLEESGLIAKLPELLKTKVYVGASAGSMIAQENLATASQALHEFSQGNWDIDFSTLGYEGRRSTATLGLVDFLICPHYGSGKEYMTSELLQELANRQQKAIYALDDESAVVINGDDVRVVSEGLWNKIEPRRGVK